MLDLASLLPPLSTRDLARTSCSPFLYQPSCRREQTQAKHFKDIWGFLVSSDPPTSVSITVCVPAVEFSQSSARYRQVSCMQLTRPHAVKTVKYVNPRGGTWTVAAQRIPVQSKDDIEADAVSCCFSIWMLVLHCQNRSCHAPSSPAHHELETSVSLSSLLLGTYIAHAASIAQPILPGFALWMLIILRLHSCSYTSVCNVVAAVQQLLCTQQVSAMQSSMRLTRQYIFMHAQRSIYSSWLCDQHAVVGSQYTSLMPGSTPFQSLLHFAFYRSCSGD